MKNIDVMRKYALAMASVLVGGMVWADEPALGADVTVDLGKVVRPIGRMNAVNNGPVVPKRDGGQPRDNFDEYSELEIPYARTHDSVGCVSGGAHCCDISVIFPNFDADENDPKNYDFVFTDHYLNTIVRAGTKVFFRLGQTIEHGPKKYGVKPPKDFAKWARICEHVIRHYNEGWGWGSDDDPTTLNVEWSNQFNIDYWEIWNEADLDTWGPRLPNGLPKNPKCWSGTEAQFFEFYATVAKYLKSKFPKLKIGGPGLCGNYKWQARFLDYLKANDVPLDFHSWHIYGLEPNTVAALALQMRNTLDKHGFEKTESILDEWNTCKGWTDDYPYAINTVGGSREQKGSAFVAATMIACSRAPVDMLMYYDARWDEELNGMFDRTMMKPLRAYYAFVAWRKLRALGTEVACSVQEANGEKSDALAGVGLDKLGKAAKGQYYAIAAKGKDGKSGALFVTRYSSDDNTTGTGTLKIKVPGADLQNARVHLTDAKRIFTEVRLHNVKDDTATIRMMPDSFVIVEFELAK